MEQAFADIQKFHLESESDTKCLANTLAAVVTSTDVICLIGDLGAGKTFFARAFIRALTTPYEEVPSPTFTIVQIYETAESIDFSEVWHVDLYRMSRSKEVNELGLEDAFSEYVCIIEWPDRAKFLLPDKRLEIHFDFCDSWSERSVLLRGHKTWQKRLLGKI